MHKSIYAEKRQNEQAIDNYNNSRSCCDNSDLHSVKFSLRDDDNNMSSNNPGFLGSYQNNGYYRINPVDLGTMRITIITYSLQSIVIFYYLLENYTLTRIIWRRVCALHLHLLQARSILIDKARDFATLLGKEG